jgi:hypothetical protein
MKEEEEFVCLKLCYKQHWILNYKRQDSELGTPNLQCDITIVVAIDLLGHGIPIFFNIGF